jgi:dTDP-4-dehydrorhamnose reductase
VPLAEKEHEVHRMTADITSHDDVAKELASIRPAWVFHLAAFTRVDDCESKPDLAHHVNADGAGNVAGAAHDVGASLLYISTDYVFDGKAEQPYREEDSTGPLSVYGRSKLEGEHQVRRANPRHLIVRTSWLYGHHGRCFPKAILDRVKAGAPLRVVNDQRGAPTWTIDLARGLLALVGRGAVGETFHCSAGGACTWFDFAEHIVGRSGREAQIEAIGSAAFGAPAPRPAYSVLSNDKFEQATGNRLRDWKPPADEFLDEELQT